MSAKVIGAVAALGAVGAVGFVGYAGLSGYQTSQIEKEIAATMAEYEPQVTLEYDSINSSFLSSSAEMLDVNLTLETGETLHFERVVGNKRGSAEMYNGVFTMAANQSMTVDRVIVHEFDVENEEPLFANVSVEGMQLESNGLLGPQVIALTSLGYNLEELTSDMDFQYKYDEASQQLNFSFSNSVTEVGALSGQATIGNIDLEEFADEMVDISETDATLIGMELSYQDDSLIPRVYDFVSNLQQVPVEDVEKLALGYVDQLQVTLPDGEFKRQATTAAASFIENPNSLTLSVSPNTPLPFEAMSEELSDKRDLDYFVNYFGLSISANQ